MEPQPPESACPKCEPVFHKFIDGEVGEDDKIETACGERVIQENVRSMYSLVNCEKCLSLRPEKKYKNQMTEFERGFAQGAASRDGEISGMTERAMMDKAEIQELKNMLVTYPSVVSERDKLEAEVKELKERWEKLRKFVDDGCSIEIGMIGPWDDVLCKMTELSGGE